VESNTDENSDDPGYLRVKRAGDPMIARMVSDAGGNADLGMLLEQVRDLGSGAAPTPSAELAALLATGLPGSATSKRRSSPRRPALLILILVGVLGATAAGAAVADDAFRSGAQVAIAHVIKTLTPFRQPAHVPSPSHQRPRPQPRATESSTLAPPGSNGPDSGHNDADPVRIITPVTPDDPTSDPVQPTGVAVNPTGSPDEGVSTPIDSGEGDTPN
jgi:hypothetical protein